MHESSYEKMMAFRDEYARSRDGSKLRVLEVGSQTLNSRLKYRDLFPSENYDYVGLDVESGPGVDLVASDPYCWSEIKDASFDLVISGQAFEHIPLFWITMAEMVRVLRPSGLICLIAPSAGAVHRYPFDCWRFYPDSGSALCQYFELSMVEMGLETKSFRKRVRIDWREIFLVARSPSSSTSDTVKERISLLVRSRPITALKPLGLIEGPALRKYEANVTTGLLDWANLRVRRCLYVLWRGIVGVLRHLIKKILPDRTFRQVKVFWKRN
jgi:SAM-dependent methyltransferase